MPKGRPQKYFTPEEQKAAHARAMKKYHSTPKGKASIERNTWKQNEKKWRFAQRQRESERSFRRALRILGLRVVNSLHATPLFYMDRHGAIHREDTRSAEQLIRDFQRQAKGKRRKEPHR